MKSGFVSITGGFTVGNETPALGFCYLEKSENKSPKKEKEKVVIKGQNNLGLSGRYILEDLQKEFGRD